MDWHDSGSRLHRTCRANELESISDMIRGRHLLGPHYCEHCVELWTAIPKINRLSSGAHQWFAMPACGLYLGNERRSRSFLVVGYSNPAPTGPNALCFAVPTLVEYAPIRPTVFACFAPRTYKALSTGLYWRDGDLVRDPLEDFSRCYEPVRDCLWPVRTELDAVKTTELREIEAGSERSNLDGISYQESIEAHVRLLVDSKEELENAFR